MLWVSPSDAVGFVHDTGFAIVPVGRDPDYPHKYNHPKWKWRTLGYLPDEDILDQWPVKGCGVGVLCGPSNLAVIDWDDIAPPSWPRLHWPTLWKASTNRGLPHEYYAQPSGDKPRISNSYLEFGEVRGVGGIAIVSDRPDNGAPIIEVPDEIIAAIEAHRRGGSTKRTLGPVTYNRATVIGHLPVLLRGISVAEIGPPSSRQSQGFIQQHVERFLREQSPGHRHETMLRTVEATFIEGMAAQLHLGDAHYELGVAWDSVKSDDPEHREYDEMWLGEVSRLEGADAELIARITERIEREMSAYVTGRVVEAAGRNGDEVEIPSSLTTPPPPPPPEEMKALPAPAPAPAPDLWLPIEFWDKSDRILHEIWLWALSKRMSPDTLLDLCLARVGACVPHTVSLPADDGMNMALGMYAAPMGPSGKGKSTGMKLARALIPAGEEVVDPISPASGESIPEAFWSSEKIAGKTGTRRFQRWFNGIVEYSEGAKMLAQGGRGGATMMMVLRGAYTNDVIGEDPVDPTKRRKLNGDEYVMSILLGLQPELSRELFSELEIAGGTPQRFLFSAVERADWHEFGDRDLKLFGRPPPLWESPTPLVRPSSVGLDESLAGALGPPPIQLTFSQAVLDEVAAMRESRSLYGAVFDPLDSHEPVVRMKTAGTLSLLLDKSYTVADRRWEQARQIYDRSRRVRTWVLEQLRSIDRRAEDRSITRDGRRAVHVEAVTEKAERERRFDRVAKRMWHLIAEAGAAGMGRGDLRRALSREARPIFDEVRGVGETRDWWRKLPGPGQGEDKVRWVVGDARP